MYVYLVCFFFNIYSYYEIIKSLKRTTAKEKKYLVTEVRQEAVQQALAAMQNRPKPSLPMPSKRTSVMAKSPDRERHDSGR